MQLTRRGFLKLAGATAATATLASVGLNKASAATVEPLRIKYTQEMKTVCTFCGVGCGIICNVRDGVIVNTEGDPDHPISEGSLCSKGSSLFNLSYVFDTKGHAIPNPKRLTKPLYRAAGSKKWEEKSWDWMLAEIATRIKNTREESFEATSNGVTVNRAPALAWLGSAFCTNEENYLFQKMARSLGIIDLDHCARL